MAKHQSGDEPLELVYFPLWAKVGSAIALEHSGLEWRYTTPQDWKQEKSSLQWCCLPVLKNIPAESGSMNKCLESCNQTLGHEAAILNYIAERCPDRMKGKTMADFLASQQYRFVFTILGVALPQRFMVPLLFTCDRALWVV